MTDQRAQSEVIDLESLRGAVAGSEGRSRVRGAERGRGRLVAGVGLVVLLLLSFWGYRAYLRADSVRQDLVSARGELDQAAAAVNRGELAEAEGLLASANETFASVPGRIGSPLLFPARLVPQLRRTLSAVSDLSRAAELVTDAGLSITRAVGADAEGLGALTPTQGRIPVEALRDLAPVLAAVETDIVRARSILSDVAVTGLDQTVLDARNEFLTLIEPLADQVGTARRLVDTIPALFGAEADRRYMVVAANPAEARGSGGFFGAFTIMTAAGGDLSFEPVRPTEDLPIVARGRIPWPDESLEQRYGAYGGSGFLLNLNMTPDFPSAAEAIENYYAVATGETLDGIIAVDPFAFEALLRIAGPVEVPGVGPVGAEQVVEFVSHGAYAVITDPEERKRLIGLVATAALEGFLDRPEGVTTEQLLGALGEMVRRQSLLVHSSNDDEQTVLEELGVTGELAGSPGDLLAVFLNSGAPYKVDYWLQRQLRYDVVLAPGGRAAATLSTGFVNDAPLTGEPDYMIGQGIAPLDVGDVLSYISVYCAPGCNFYEVPDAGFDDLTTERGEELGLDVTSTWMRLPSGQSRELVWSYTTPNAWQMSGVNQIYRLHYDHQTSILPIELDIRVAVPDGYEPLVMPEGSTVVDGVVRIADSVSADTDIMLTFAPTA